MVGYAFHYKKINHEVKGRRGGDVRSPAWLQLLLRSKFFGACDDHREIRKSEMNIYCIDCNHCMCPHCLATHPSPHRLLQIRRYVYQDVVRINDIHKLLDCSKVQPYTVNSAKVVLLNPRRQSKPSKGSGGGGGAMCEICGRTVTEPYRYCSIGCKASDEAEVALLSDSDDEGSNDGLLSGPFIPSLKTPSYEVYSPCLSEPQPSDSSEENGGHWMRNALSPKRKIARRKGYPRRAPIF